MVSKTRSVGYYRSRLRSGFLLSVENASDYAGRTRVRDLVGVGTVLITLIGAYIYKQKLDPAFIKGMRPVTARGTDENERTRSLAHLALLRGMNVGGKNILPMSELVDFFRSSGGSNVRTYIQSGNVVFNASSTLAKTVSETVRAKIASRFGYKIPIVLRTLEQMDETINENPFLKAGSPEKNLHVLFLADIPDPAAVAGLDQKRSEPDRFTVRGRDVYLDLPNGAGRTKLTNAYFDAKLSTVSTGRNWATVRALWRMMGE